MEKTEIQRRFTTTIPKKVRQKLGLKEGTRLLWDIEEGRKGFSRPRGIEADSGRVAD